MRYGLIEWKSKRYPHKTYQAFCLTPGQYIRILTLVFDIPDYHTIVEHHSFEWTQFPSYR
jgi:hypothetical protein